MVEWGTHQEVVIATPPAGRLEVVLLQGARQTGMTTLARHLSVGGPEKRQYLTLDDAAVLAAARDNPSALIDGLRGPVAFDEVQFAPGLFPFIKASVERGRAPGRFLLTGSANILLLPKLAESLAGQMELLTLWPFSQGELKSTPETFIDWAFATGGRRPWSRQLPRPSTGSASLSEATQKP